MIGTQSLSTASFLLFTYSSKLNDNSDIILSIGMRYRDIYRLKMDNVYSSGDRNTIKKR